MLCWPAPNIMIKNTVFLLGILQLALCYSSEAEQSLFKKITSWDQMSIFAGKLIAYKTTSLYLQNDTTFTDTNGDNYYYGLVDNYPNPWDRSSFHHKNNKAYSVNRLISQGETSMNCAFVNGHI